MFCVSFGTTLSARFAGVITKAKKISRAHQYPKTENGNTKSIFIKFVKTCD